MLVFSGGSAKVILILITYPFERLNYMMLLKVKKKQSLLIKVGKK